MRQQQPSGPELTIDEPFELNSSDLVDEVPIDLLPSRRTNRPTAYVAVGPNGTELVDPIWCEEPTVVMSADQSQELLEQVRAELAAEELTKELVRGLHTRPTVRSMQAVSMPPSRPVPPVEVVEASGEWTT